MSLMSCINSFTIIPWFLTHKTSLLSGVDDELQNDLVCGNETNKNNRQEKVLGVTIYNSNKFNKYHQKC